MNKQVILPLAHGGYFSVDELIDLMGSMERTALVIGQQAAAQVAHTKTQSLDFILRRFARHPDTKQAEKVVVDSLVATGRFVRAMVLCPDTGRRCKGLQLLH